MEFDEPDLEDLIQDNLHSEMEKILDQSDKTPQQTTPTTPLPNDLIFSNEGLYGFHCCILIFSTSHLHPLFRHFSTSHLHLLQCKT